MDRKVIKELMAVLYDKPLDKNSKTLLVDRRKELARLENITSFQPLGIYGVCGETGVGKTTVLNLLNDTIKSFYIILSEKDSKEIIIGDLLYKLALISAQAVNRGDKNKVEKIIEWIITERTETSSMHGGINSVVSAGATKASSVSRKFNVYQAYQMLGELIDILKNKFERIVLIIDELDKEKKSDVLQILDSLKHLLVQNGVISIISLPFSIYREYAQDRLRWNESGNLENIFKDMIFLEPLKLADVQEMLVKRLKNYPDILTNDAYQEIVRFSDGNPRDALWITQQIILDNTEARKIDGSIATNSIKKIVKEYMKFGRALTDIQKKILMKIALNPGDRSSIANSLENEVKPQTTYTYINRLIKEGFLLERNGIISVPGKIYFSLLD
ncbi:MAG: ATPase [Kosmotoga sp.]|uniref:ATP-binding protein n=1 Tax=Kosmotoga sp. TaxID=1955248 RepID=UPI001DBADE7E|nr:ATP-binding protein [Kosmotoga sp.]MBO8166061.1 ATPase [Kosmotoga sp.]